jgi:UDP-3-O-[3-hydroxymyristoyl] glucosamine N-acyltransferase
MRLSHIAARLGARLDGRDTDIQGVAGIEAAGPGQLTFIANPRYASVARTTRASAIIVAEDFPALPIPTLRTRNPYLAFTRALEIFYQPPQYAAGVHPTAVIASSARVPGNASIGPFVVIDDDVEIGPGCVLLAHVVIYRGARIGRNFFAHAHSIVREYCRVGDDVTLQNGAIIGADGFGFAKNDSGQWEKIVQSGPAVLEDGVEVQANACVDRASVGETRIGRGSKIDNLVQVGHGSSVGQDTLLCAQVGLAGSTEIGDRAILAGQVGVAGHCRIGDDVVATAQSGIPNDVEDGKMVSGYPAIENRQWLRCVAVFNRLPELARSLRGNATTKAGDKKR